MIFNEHKHRELANEIEKEYVNLCNKQPCGECKYAFQSYCKTLFILDCLEKRNRRISRSMVDGSPYVEAISEIKRDIQKHQQYKKNKYKECLKKMSKEDLLNIEKLLEEDK